MELGQDWARLWVGGTSESSGTVAVEVYWSRPQSLPLSVYSPNNQALLIFSADSSVQQGGITVHWESGMLVMVDWESGTR